MNKIDQFRDLVKQNLDAHPTLAWREELPGEQVDRLVQEHAPKSRLRVWPVEALLWCWLTIGLWRERSFEAITEELWVPLCLEFPKLALRRLNRGRSAEGRARVPVALLKEVRMHLARKGAHEGRGMGTWRGHRVLWMDGSTLSMPAEPALQKHFGFSPCAFPLARIVNLGVAATRVVIGSAYGRYQEAEVPLAISLVEQIEDADIVTGDRLLGCSPLLWAIRQRGANAVMRKHAQLKIQKHPRYEIGPDDWIVELKIDRHVRQRYPELPLPEKIDVRVFRVEVGNSRNHRELWIETTFLDAKQYPREALADLYWTRWGAETSYAEVKVDLHLDVLRSKTVEGVQREIEAHLAAYNYVRLQMIRAAKQAGVNPTELSFVEAVRIIVRVTQVLRHCASDSQRQEALSVMITQVGAARVPRRPHRHEPRHRRRKPKKFPTLRTSRAQWREDNGYTQGQP